MPDAKSLLKDFQNLLGDANVVTAAGEVAGYFKPSAEAPGLIAVKPGNLEDVQKVMSLANQEKVPVLTIIDGNLPAADAEKNAVVLDFSRMNTVDRLDAQNLLGHVWRGLTWSQLKEACDKEGVTMPTPVAASSESVLTNIIGRNMLKQANQSPEVNVHTMKVVLADGRLHKTGPHALKDEACDIKEDGGPSLSRWYLGSDDIYGVVCRAAVYLYPKTEAREALCFSFSDYSSLLKALRNVPRTEVGYEYIGANARYLSWLLDKSPGDLPAWTAIVGFAGTAKHVDFQKRKVNELMSELGGKAADELNAVMTEKIDEVWYRAAPAHTEFYSVLSRVEEFDDLVQGAVKSSNVPADEVGQLLTVYDRGRCAGVFYDFFGQENGFGAKVEELNLQLAAKGALFNRPQGKLAEQIFGSVPNYTAHLRTIKKVVDPNFIINPDRVISKDGEAFQALTPDESLGDNAGITVDNVKQVAEKLKEAIGDEWVSDNPVDLGHYSRDFTIYSGERPNIVVLPKTIEEIQKIMRIAYSHSIPVVPMTTGFNHGGLTVTRKGGILIDLRRMDDLGEIDEESMTAVIQPGVRMRFLYREAHKVTSYKDIPLKPILPLTFGSISLLSNYISRGGPGSAVKYSGGPDLTASMTWVLPNGEVLRTGSSAFPNVGEVGINCGPGPEIGGMFFNADGAFGVCTNVTVKLYPEQFHEEYLNAAMFMEDSLPIVCNALYDFAQSNVLEFIYKTHAGTMAVTASLMLGGDPKTIAEIAPEDVLLIVVNGIEKEEVDIKLEICREIINKHMLVEIDPEMFGEGLLESDPIEPTKMALGVENNMVGAHKGAFQWQAGYLKLCDTPEAWDRYKKLIEKYWKTSDPKINLKQAMTGSAIQGPIPYGRACAFEFDFWWDQGNPEDVKRATTMFRKATELLFDMGSLPIRNMFGFGEMLIPRLGVYTEILKDVRHTFDPENLMHPDVLPLTDDYV